MQTGVQRSASAADDLVCKPPLSCCQRMLDPERNPRNGMQTGVQSSTSAAGDLVCKPPLSCCQRMLDPAGRRGLVGQSACLVNRRSWVQIPAVPLNRWLFSAGSFLDRRPWQCLCFSNFIPIVQRPKDLVLPTHRARNLTPMDRHKEKNFLLGSVAQWIAHWTSRLLGEAIQRLWVRVPPEL